MKKLFRRFWVIMGMVLVLSFITAAQTTTTQAGSLLYDWFRIGTDAVSPVYYQLKPSIAYNPDRQEYLVVWYNERPVYPDIQAQRVGVDGQLVGGPFYIAGGEGAKRRYPDVVYNPTHQEYLVVWEELLDEGHSNIISQRVSGLGILNGGTTTLGSGPEVADCFRPAVAYASTADLYMVVWKRLVQAAVSSDIEVQILSSTNTTIGGNILVEAGTTTTNHEEPDIAYNRSRNEYLIVWTREDLNIPVKDVWGQIITRDGILLGSDFFIGYHTANDSHPAVAGKPTLPNFGGYYVVWQMLHAPGDNDIYGKEVYWDGTIASSYDEINRSMYNDTNACIEYNETADTFFVGWSRLTNGALGTKDIIGGLMQPGDSYISTESFVGGEFFSEHPAIAAGPKNDFLVAWDDAVRTADRDVYGRLWGDRYFVYLPLLMR